MKPRLAMGPSNTLYIISPWGSLQSCGPIANRPCPGLLEFEQYHFHGFIAEILRQMLSRIRPGGVVRLADHFLRCAVRQVELHVAVVHEHGHRGWMLVHHRFFMWSVRDPQHANLIITED